ncbi:olfactory receptor 13C9-like [Gastrophryne carolinensis]
MDPSNQTLWTELILVGYSSDIKISIIFFSTLLLMYVFSIFGNIFIVITIILSPKLHTPMYFFLCNLSLLDVCYSSCSLPKAMVDIFSRKRTVSVTGCMVQITAGITLGSTESFQLAVMAYDRYVAICFPLHYTSVMSWKKCRSITIMIWLASFTLSTGLTNFRPMVFCRKNTLDHFSCELLAVLELACGDPSILKMAILFVSFLTLVLPFVFIIVSYILIISSILKISSTVGRFKAFSTCASHLIVVSMFYGTTITMYTGQRQSFSSNLKYMSLVYGTMTPVLNPMIYSLRNNDMKEAFHKLVDKYFERIH